MYLLSYQKTCYIVINIVIEILGYYMYIRIEDFAEIAQPYYISFV